ncbi:hypothetical protein HMI56_006110 [Coelomomyces lativittatus]|nr:hypothetical protein HMI56_006110 [Coelomomyces lativittatus]
MSQGASSPQTYIAPHLRDNDRNERRGDQSQDQQQHRPKGSYNRGGTYRGDQTRQGGYSNYSRHGDQSRQGYQGSGEVSKYHPPSLGKDQYNPKSDTQHRMEQISHRIRITLTSPNLRKIEKGTLLSLKLIIK